MKRLPWTVAMVAAAVLLAGCGEVTNTLTPPPGTANTITVALDSPPNLTQVGIIEAQALGYFKQTDETVKFIVDPHPINDLHDRKAQVALTSEPEIILARNHHTALASVAAVLQLPGKPQVVCKTSSGTTSGGKTTTTASSTTVTTATTTTAPRSHPPLHAAKTTSMHVSDCKASYQSDTTYAGAPTYNALNLVVTENEIINHAPLIRRFVQAVGRGYAEVQKDPSQAAALLVKERPGFPFSEALTGIKYFLPDFFPTAPNAKKHPWGFQTVLDWNHFGTWLYDHHIITNVNATPDAVTNELLAGQGV